MVNIFIVKIGFISKTSGESSIKRIQLYDLFHSRKTPKNAGEAALSDSQLVKIFISEFRFISALVCRLENFRRIIDKANTTLRSFSFAQNSKKRWRSCIKRFSNGQNLHRRLYLLHRKTEMPPAAAGPCSTVKYLKYARKSLACRLGRPHGCRRAKLC